MTSLLLSARYTEDSKALRSAALEMGWHVERIQNWRDDLTWLKSDQFVLYGEGIFAQVISETLGLTLLEPSPDWLTMLPYEFLHRHIQYLSAAETRR